MNDWKKVRLSDVADIKLSNVDKKTNIAERPIRLCNYTDVYKNTFINSYKSKDFMIASCNDNEYEKFVLKKGQVAITKDSEKRDDIGISTYIAESFDDVVLGYHLSLITPFDDRLDGRFLNYWFNTNQAKIYFENNAGGSGQRCTLPIDIIKGIPIKLPDLPTQQKIASVLSTLDDKIELNNRINTELEAMAKTLYDYWFVQFDFPIVTSSGVEKPYKTSGGKMVYNETLKREIPEGWEVKSLYEIANIIMGQSPKGESYNEKKEGTIFFQGSTDFGWRFPKNRVYTSTPTRFAKENDILLSVRAPIGTMNLAMENCCIGRGLSALNSKDGYSSFLIYQMHYFKKKFDLLNSVGTTFGSLTKDELYNLVLVYPSKKILEKFENLVSEFDKKIKINSKQNQELSALRDWLLPMLMNGQVKVG
ncbi:restriction endonuclease subunit S [Epilithonimonas hominis]|uniref:Type I restriction enzyme, S subunit n=1 Tax=Epilithonimonas hominis TaxID=420404 RepID=A0A1H6HR49_9FLAO|nr:restriction endonuclease subunit S [Epilithonimonas hominis]SEH38340.1 type I restriction enzyme, S subunit [Epilithonimonas hominis]